ncbi:hypothetical protein OROGR_028846 [Orobanche gracilis]
MGISFKVSKAGKRFNPKPPPTGAASFTVEDEASKDVGIGASKKTSDSISFLTRKPVGEGSDNKGNTEISDNEVSFCLNIFPDGYSVEKPMESESRRHVPKFLHPYDRASEALFSAVESGRLPGDILDDIPCKYYNGTLVCEVRDHRKCFSEGLNVASVGSSPVIIRVRLSMSLENIVKDIPAISDNNWTYGDLMEVESRILKALQPQLSLDPTPQLIRLSDNTAPTKLNLELRSMRRKRLRQIPEVSVTSNNLHGKKVCLERVSDSSRPGDSGSLGQQPTYENLNSQNRNTMLPLRNNSFVSDGSLLASHPSKHQIGVASPRMMKDQRLASPRGQDMMIPVAGNNASLVHGKRENQDEQSSPIANKKARLEMDNLQHLGPQIDSLHGNELQWRNTLMHQQSIGKGIQYAPNNKFSQQVFEGGVNPEGSPMPFTIGQQGIRYNLKDEPVETDRLDKHDPRMTMGESELANIDPRLQQRMPAQFMRLGCPQSPWNNLGQTLDNNNNNPRKEDSYQKRKLVVQSPHVSAGGGLPQSPLSSKSGEFSSGSHHQFGAVVSSGHVPQKEKSGVTSVHSVGANDSMQRQHQAGAKRRSNSVPKTPAITGVGSPVSVSNMSVPISGSSPPVGSQTLVDQTMLERFSKIGMVSMRCQLNHKKNKVDESPRRKPNAYSAQELMRHLSTDSNNEILKDETFKLSKSLIAGSMNVSKTRIMNFIQTERIIQGNTFQLVTKARTRMIMSEKSNDGAVAFHIGEIAEAEYLAAEDYLPTLPNTDYLKVFTPLTKALPYSPLSYHIADLLATQFCSLMRREGYDVEDHLQPKSVRINPLPRIPPTSEMHQFSEGVYAQLPNDITRPSGTAGNAPLNSPRHAQVPRMLPPENNQNQAIHMSQGLLAGGVSIPYRPQQQTEQQLLPPQPPQSQRSHMMLPSLMQHLNASNMQLGGPHMANKYSALQLQILQQQRKVMPAGLGKVGIGNIGNNNSNNNMAGFGGLGGVMGARGVAGNRIPASMGPTMSTIGSMNLSSAANAIRNGTMTPEQAAILKLRMQNRANMNINMNTMLGAPQSSRQMHPGTTAGLSMLDQVLSRSNLNMGQMQPHTSMGQMGPPKLMLSGMNIYMNQQQQQQLHLHQQMQLQQQHQMQQHQQQETTSPLQAVVSPLQVGSPSGSMGIGHQMNQQQMQQQQASAQQRTPMSPQLSSGGMNGMTAGNPEACPASPQLSSQTMGSVGSLVHSPMEMPGVNKSNSIN